MKTYKVLYLIPLILLLVSGCGSKKRVFTNSELSNQAKIQKYIPSKRELRAAWMPTVFRSEYSRLTPEGIRRNLIQKLDLLQHAGFNAVIFQIRSEADAWYYSPYEPWSRYLTGEQGKAPQPLWDPLQFLVEECHKRNMELHAWLNPYRAATSKGAQMAPNHPFRQHPEWFVTYGQQLLFNPALPEVRNYVSSIIKDIVERYDIDAIHMDDYFYPYPIAGVPFPDRAEYIRQTRGQKDINDWRRENVNMMVQQIHEVIKTAKPYVRFGISPFGIYRNQKNDPDGSKTFGLQNYDDLYADILLWDKMDWVDYIMPQLYWQIGNRAAEYTELAYWWERNILRAHYYIGQDIRRTLDHNELHAKMNITQKTAQGQCFWPGDDLFTNYAGITQALKSNYWYKPALIPPTPYPDNFHTFDEPHREAFISKVSGNHELVWEPDIPYPKGLETKYFVIYCHPRGTKLSRATTQEYLMDITQNNHIALQPIDGKQKVAFTITRVNRFNHEIVVAHNIKAKL